MRLRGQQTAPPQTCLKILLLSHSFFPDIGGIESISEMLACSFANMGHLVHLVTLTGGRAKKKFCFTVIRRPNIFKLFRQHAWADIVFENNPCLQLSWMRIFFGKPNVTAIQTWISRMNNTIGWKDRVKFALLKQATSVIACSNPIREKYAPLGYVVGNPYNEAIFKRDESIDKTLHFVFLGRLVSDKGAELVVNAVNMLVNSSYVDQKILASLSVTIIGDGPEKEHLEKATAEFGLQHKITFTGAVKGRQLVECLNRHRFIIVPSVWEEPFGIVALEGMACGCLPIVSNTGGLPEAIGGAGLLFKKGDATALANCMTGILNNPTAEERLRNAAPAHLAMFRSQEVSKKYLSIFQTALCKTA